MQISDQAFATVVDTFHKSYGEAAYSMATLLADKMGKVDWEVVGTDLSTTVVSAAQRALYPMDRARDTPTQYLKRFCQKGQGPYEGQLLIDKGLRWHVHFMQASLMQTLPDIGHSESLNQLPQGLVHLQPAVYARA